MIIFFQHHKKKEQAVEASKLLNLNAYCIECNSLPSLGRYSHFAAAALEENINYSELINKIIELSFEKNK